MNETARSVRRAMFRRKRSIAAWLAVLIIAGIPAHALAASSISQVPLFLTQPVPPIAIIDMPKDQSLFKKAYNDYSDLDGDGIIETTYDNSIEYAGYFDSGICYSYSGGTFVPSAKASTTTKTVGDDTVEISTHYCDGSHWSGNFLNWVTMSRMDIVRQILYGGKRSQDSDTLTVLERAYIPPDAHSWAKYYNGDDLSKLTPFSTSDGINTQPPVTTSTHPCNVNGNCSDTEVAFPSSFPYTTDTYYCGKGNYAKLVFGALAGQIFYVGDQVKIYPGTSADPGRTTNYMIGGVCSIGTGSDGTPSVTVRVDQNALVGVDSELHQFWVLENLSQTGISFCNTTMATSDSALSQDVTAPPLMRVAKGNYSLWSANEKFQCYWSEEKNKLQSGFAGAFRSNGNRAALSGLDASAENPSQSRSGLGIDDYHVEVQACVVGYIKSVRCKPYIAGYEKPIGLLQEYGDPGDVRFGLFTGSYLKNFSGGVLRSNVKDWSSEISANGSFTGGGIVDTLDKLRIYGYSYADGTYQSDNCSYQITDPLTNGEGNCKSWGNPISEIYLESLRYLAGADSATPAFSVPSGSVLKLQVASSWNDPLNQKNFCSALGVLVFNTSVATYDDDQMDGLATLTGGKGVADWTNDIGTAEGITGAWFVGNTGSATIDALCDAKTITSFGDVSGICPQAPSQHGSWLIDGAAFWAHTNHIRADLVVPPVNTTALKVDTYGIQLAASVPRISVPVGDNTVTILPAYRLDKHCDYHSWDENRSADCTTDSSNLRFGTGTLVDFKVISRSADGTSGRYYLSWEDSTQGGDYDQDMWGTLSYRVDTANNTVTITTDAVSASTNNAQGFGYIISGTTDDGPHFYSGIYGFDFPDDGNPWAGECNDCRLADAPTSNDYIVGQTSAGSLKPPLYYAAKWGGFADQNDNGKPDQTIEWDANGDGLPDNYFFANNPAKLYEILGKALKRVVRTESSATSIATNSTRLDTESAVFQARFKSGDWYGQLLSFEILADGSIGDAIWDAAEVLDTQAAAARSIFTWVPPAAQPWTTSDYPGAPFQYAELNSNEKAALDGTDGLGIERVAYLRGDRSYEILNGGTFRDRVHVLGDIVNSNPYYVSGPDYRYFSLPRAHNATPPAEPATDVCGLDDTIVEACTYNDFRHSSSYAGRTPTVYVGANDGMLHAINANTGEELFAYVPSGVYSNLAMLTSPAYGSTTPHHYFVDGSVNVNDAWFKKADEPANAWHTVLVGALGAGGKGVYALDITSPETFGATDVLWEYDGAGDDDLGSTIGQPTVVRLNDHNWYVVFANGYESTSGLPVLYLIRLDATSFVEGTTVFKIKPQGVVSSCTINQEIVSNGLSTPVPVDVVRWDDVDNAYVSGHDRVTDYIYAGDLCGELIKFDLTDINSSSWNGQVLFTATDGQGHIQPITDRPDVGTSPQSGQLIYFGTGTFFRDGDNNVASVDTDTINTFYAIRDAQRLPKDNFAAVIRDNLVQQSIIYQDTSDGKMVRAVSQNPVDYSDTGGKQGWYLNLVPPSGVPEGERVVSRPLLRDGRIIFTTLIPAPQDEPCEFGGTGWLMELDATEGGRLNMTVLDINGDGLFNDEDFVTVTVNGNTVKVPVSGLRSTIGIISTPGIIEAGRTEYKYTSGSSGTIGVITEKNSSGHGRKSWKELR